MTGNIVVVSGPSGSGKTSLTRKICETHAWTYLSISSTTREPRDGEVNGVDYHFLTKETFLKDIEEGMFLEWAEVHGNFYGTSLRSVQKALDEGKTVIFDIDVQGHEIVRKRYGKSVSSVFVTTPSLSVLKERLHNRATDSDEIIAKRVINALGELEHLPVYDAIVINEDFNESIDMLESLIKASRWKQKIDDLPQFISGWRSGTLV